MRHSLNFFSLSLLNLRSNFFEIRVHQLVTLEHQLVTLGSWGLGNVCSIYSREWTDCSVQWLGTARCVQCKPETKLCVLHLLFLVIVQCIAFILDYFFNSNTRRWNHSLRNNWDCVAYLKCWTPCRKDMTFVFSEHRHDYRIKHPLGRQDQRQHE